MNTLINEKTVLWLLLLFCPAPGCGGGGGDEGDADAGDTDAADDKREVRDAEAREIPHGDIDYYHPECIEVPFTQVIAIWDVVPFQAFSSTFKAGVVAFHELGLDVVFRVSGTEVGRAADPAFNDRTNVYEYWVEIDAADYPDGPITLTATAEPDCAGHVARELPELVLYANAGGSLTNPEVRWADCGAGSDETGDGSEASPYATIEKAFTEVGPGGTVNLEAGDCYMLTNLYPEAGYDRWTTVQPAPGVPVDGVRILAYGPTDESTGRFGESMVRWKDVSLFKDVDPGYSTIFYFESNHVAWFDGADLYDARGQWNGGQLTGGNDPYMCYYTGARIHDIMNAGLAFARNVSMEYIGSDVFRGTSDLLSVNLTVLGIDPGDTDAHPDFIQFYNPDSTVDNVIVYNARVFDMEAQGIFGGPGAMRNVAFVNLLMEKDPADSYAISQLTGDWDHLLMWHVTTVDSGMLLREPDNIRNTWIVDGIWASLSAGTATELPGFVIDHNRTTGLTWEQTEPMGTNASVGDPMFLDESVDDYSLAAGSPAIGAGVPLAGVPADIDGYPYNGESPSLGAFEHP
jgi:hypothetical protein